MWRYINASNSLAVLGTRGRQASLISLQEGTVTKVIELPEDPDGRIGFFPDQHCFVCAAYDEGLFGINLDTGRITWRKKIKAVTKLRTSQSDSVLIVCRNDPPEVTLMNPVSGTILDTIRNVTDGFLESLEGASAFLNLNNEIMFKRQAAGALLKWGQFAIYDASFSASRLAVTGTNATLASYDLDDGHGEQCQHGSEFSRCDPIFLSAEGKVLGFVFEPNGAAKCQLVKFDKCLMSEIVIAESELVFAASFCNKGSWLFDSSGKLIDTSTGRLVKKIEQQ